MSFVGNEYWAGSVATSSDPAAASCTQVALMVMTISMTMMKKLIDNMIAKKVTLPLQW